MKERGAFCKIGLLKAIRPIPTPSIISNGIMLLFYVRCIATQTLSRAFGLGDFAAHLEKRDCKSLVPGCGRR